jgi:hypothetical protein
LAQLRLQVFKVDRLRKKICCAMLRRPPPPLVITVSGHHHDGQIGEALLDLTEQLQPIHAGHVATNVGSISPAIRSNASAPEVA